MQNTLLAKRYAKALFELSLELKKLDEVYEDMLLLQETVADSMAFRQFLVSPVIQADKKTKVMKAMFDGKIEEVTLRFMELLAKNRRESNLKIIVSEFIELFKEYKNITTVTLQTAVKISDSLKQDILDRLSKRTGGSIDLIEKVDEKLIGGYIVSVENSQYDASLVRVFNQLRKEFEENLYIREI
jgi:F-type H+-transporting ATPase subunit delta